MKKKSILLLPVVTLFCVFQPVFAGQLVEWVEPNQSCFALTPDGNDYIAISAGQFHGLALRSDGTVVAWGCNDDGQCNIPDINDFITIGAGFRHSLGIRADGSLVAWGRSAYGICDVPAGNDYVMVKGGDDYSVAIKSDGSLFAWGHCLYGSCNVPAGNNFVDISAGRYHNLALRSDGTLSAWGNNNDGECNVPGGNDFVAIGCGMYHSLAIDSNGMLYAWGDNYYGQCDVPEGNYVAADGGAGHTVAIRSDGSLAAWGKNVWGQCDVPGGTGFVDLTVCSDIGVALTSDNTVTLTMQSEPNDMVNLTPSLGQHSYYYGKRIFVSAGRSPKCPDVYDFDHWIGMADPNSSSGFLIMDSNKIITAVYTPDERVCGDECHPIQQGDLNEDCYINLDDFALYAAKWLSCTHPDCD